MNTDNTEDSIARYEAMLVEAMPSLLKAEWLAIMDTMNATGFLEPTDFDTIWTNVEDSGILNKLGEKWKIDVPALVIKLRDLPRISQIATIEAVIRFWQQPEGEFDESLKRSGCKIV